MISNGILYEDSPYWIIYQKGYYHVYEDIPYLGYAEHRFLTDSFDEAKKYIELQKK